MIPPNDLSVRDIALRAADRLRQFGWYQGTYVNPNADDAFGAPCCVWGAINIVSVLAPENDNMLSSHRTIEALWFQYRDKNQIKVIRPGGGLYSDPFLADWNDDPNTTVGDVLAFLQWVAEQDVG